MIIILNENDYNEFSSRKIFYFTFRLLIHAYLAIFAVWNIQNHLKSAFKGSHETTNANGIEYVKE